MDGFFGQNPTGYFRKVINKTKNDRIGKRQPADFAIAFCASGFVTGFPVGLEALAFADDVPDTLLAEDVAADTFFLETERPDFFAIISSFPLISNPLQYFLPVPPINRSNKFSKSLLVGLPFLSGVNKPTIHIIIFLDFLLYVYLSLRYPPLDLL